LPAELPFELYGPLLIGLLFLLLRVLTKNDWVKRRLNLSLFFLIVAFCVGAVQLLYEDERLSKVQELLIILAVIFAVVVLLFNRFKEGAVSEKYPSIVQDAIVIGTFALVLIYDAPDKFLTTSAVGALIIGLALQDTLSNLFAGLGLQIEKPFFVGDWVRIAQLEGRVMEVTWRATKIRTKSGNYYIVPNTSIAKDTIVNFTHPSRVLRIDKRIGFGYDAHPNQVKQVVLETLKGIPDVLRDPEPDVHLLDYSDFSIQYNCRFWINDFGRREQILDTFATRLYYRLEREGLHIPFPIRDVRIREGREAERQVADVHQQHLQFIEQIDLFEPLSSEEKEEVARRLHDLTYASGEWIIRQGDPGDSMFFIRSGEIRIIVEEDGVVQQIARLSPGQYFGEMALLTGEDRSATAVAGGDVRLLELRKGAFSGILLENPKIAEEISRVLAERKQDLDERRAEMATPHGPQGKLQESILARIRNFFHL
jgi:small-conductance mechanosensitive channel/CRP-like cAMP-binding protein